MQTTSEKFNFEGTEIRTQSDKNGETLWVAKDLCDALGYSNPSHGYSKVYSDDLRDLEVVDSRGRLQKAYVVNESGMYALIFGSGKPEAERFKRWVTSDVLPSIRKTGSYGVKKPDSALMKLIPETENIFRACKSLAEMWGLSGNPALISASNATYAVTGVDVPRLLGTTHIMAEKQDRMKTPTELGKKLGVSAQKFNKLLKEIGFQEKEDKEWVPTEKGRQFAVLTDTGKKHKSGRPVQQLLWLESILDEVAQIAA